MVPALNPLPMESRSSHFVSVSTDIRGGRELSGIFEVARGACSDVEFRPYPLRKVRSFRGEG